MGDSNPNGPLFPSLSADALDAAVSVIPSLCVSCEEQGETRLLLTKIPFFKDVVVTSFICGKCEYTNRSIMPASSIEDEGVRFEIHMKTPADLQRQIVVYEGAELRLPGLDSVFPFSEGRLTTIEGALRTIQENITTTADQAKTENPDLFVQLVTFANKLGELLVGDVEFDLHLDDPRGTSFVENPHAPGPDPQMKVERYARTAQQNEQLGIVAAGYEGAPVEEEEEAADEGGDKFDPKDEVLAFPVNCPKCGAATHSNMKVVDIPHFKEVVLMAINCGACGYRDNEVKGGGGIEPRGRRLTLHATCAADLTRDVLKTDTAALRIPELELETSHGTLGGRFTTVEGLLTAVRDDLTRTNPFLFGDSARGLGGQQPKLREFVARLDRILQSEEIDVHIILDDPAGNSHIQNLCAPDPDPQLLVEEYERSAEENEMLGIDQMRTE